MLLNVQCTQAAQMQMQIAMASVLGERVFHGGYWVKAAGAAPLTQKLFNI